MVSTITSKGQITMPKRIREKLNMNTGDKVEFILDENGNVYLFPVKSSIKKLKGIVTPPSKPVSLKDMDDAVEQEGGRI